jgi:hypothetical protein
MGTAIEGKSKVVTMTPTIDTSAYASGDQLGSLVELSNALDDSSGTGTIVSVAVLDKAAQSSALTLLLFKDKPTVASSDNAALNISDSEMAKCLGIIPIAGTDYVALSANSIASVRNVNLVISSTKSDLNLNGTSLWAILRSGGSPTYGAASDLVLSIGIKQD